MFQIFCWLHNVIRTFSDSVKPCWFSTLKFEAAGTKRGVPGTTRGNFQSAQLGATLASQPLNSRDSDILALDLFMDFVSGVTNAKCKKIKTEP